MNLSDYENISWNIIDKFFNDNPNILVRHHLDSFNDFFNNKIYNIFKEKNPIKILKEQDPETKEYNLQANIYIGGKEGNRLHFGKPIIFDESRTHYMFPNEARLRNMTYGTTLHVDIVVEYNIKNSDDKFEKTEALFENIYLGKFPIMINSDLCVLNKLEPRVKFTMGECKNDRGGYFIIDGKEKVLICQEKFADNMVYIKDNYNELYSHSAEIRSVSEDASKPIRTLSIRIVSPSVKYSNNNIVVNVPNVRKPVPLFILMRALGVLSDKDIIQHCLLDMEKYEDFIDLFIPSIHDAGGIFNQELAIKYIATLTKGKTVVHVLEILMDYFLPHIGENNFKEKAYYLGFMVLKLLKVFKKDEPATDRDSFKFKRVELSGSLIFDLFKEYYTLQQKHIYQRLDKEYYYKQGIYQNNFPSLFENNYLEYFKERILESGFKKAFKGSWGSQEHTHRPEVIQDLNRLSYNSFMSHLRKLNLPLDSSAKVIGPRLLHSSQWGIIDPVDTPDGGNVGLHKHMALGTHITSGYSSKNLIELLHSVIFVEFLSECNIDYISQSTKVFVNGSWIGITNSPVESLDLLKNFRRLGLIPIFTSISWSIHDNIIYIFSDAGRLCRPCYYVKNSVPSFHNSKIKDILNSKNFNYYQLLVGFNNFKDSVIENNNYSKFVENNNIFFTANSLYKTSELSINIKNQEKMLENQNQILETLLSKAGIIDYLDTSETESSLISINEENITKFTTHLEIHPSLLLGIMGNQIVFPENNQLPRDLFSCGQSKQGVSLYHTNYQYRIDKMGVVLNNGQIPLVKSRYLKYIYNEEHPYGINAIVAIGCYGGYNVEDSILFNEGSIKRGMFNTTYLNMYESREETSKISGTNVDTKFVNIENENVINKKPGYDYSNLQDNGLIKENTQLDDKKVIIGKVTNNLSNPDKYIDSSIFPKKGQLGFVDKSFITEGEEGYRIAKVRIREERIPAMGDKFCSRCGQKGTVGLIIPEENMPFTENGIRPDLIINPHALPSRMTIGQLVETLMGKTCALYGGFGDCTAFINKGPKHKTYGNLLKNIGYNSSGNELLYNGETGEQLQAEIFIGPCYYMRLKHMVKDKINYRAKGPRTVLTRQTVQGRANDGGLRIGEMERDCLISHGITKFLEESMLERGDKYYMAICNNSGTVAIYNESRNLFISPYADGPVKFSNNLENEPNIEVITKYGRSFSIVKIPYAFKLLMQELLVLNVQMRIITDENINQLTNMNFENVIEVLKNFNQKTIQNMINDKNLEDVDENLLREKLDMQDSIDEDEESVYSETDDSLKARLNRVRKIAIEKSEEAARQELSSDEEEDKPPISIGEKIEEDDDVGIQSVENKAADELTNTISNKFNEGTKTLTDGIESLKDNLSKSLSPIASILPGNKENELDKSERDYGDAFSSKEDNNDEDNNNSSSEGNKKTIAFDIINQ